jgi:hypothetical protein
VTGLLGIGSAFYGLDQFNGRVTDPCTPDASEGSAAESAAGGRQIGEQPDR